MAKSRLNFYTLSNFLSLPNDPRHNVLKMLLKKGKITQDMIALLDKWRHSGFNVFCGPRIRPGDEEAIASGSESLRLGEKTLLVILSAPHFPRNG